MTNHYGDLQQGNSVPDPFYEHFAPNENPDIGNYQPQLDKIRSEQLDRVGFGTTGPKYDTGKPLASIPFEDFPDAIAGIIAVATYGAKKYARSSWKHVPNARQRYADAMFRHWLALALGETNDGESGLPHIDHFAWNALALAQLDAEGPPVND